MLKCSHGLLLRFSPKIPLTFSRAFKGTTYLYTYYDTLKVKPTASLKEIKQAYFELSKKYHPDLHPNDPACHDHFIRLQEAYQILSNAESKKKYDLSINPRTNYGYSSHNRRPYADPDFTERDEWIKAEHARREKQFNEEFRNQETYYDVHRQYGRPRNLTPEEMERFLKIRSLTRNNKMLYYMVGFFVIIGVIEAFYTRKHHASYYDDHTLNIRYPKRFDPGLDLEYERQKLDNERKYQEYLSRQHLVNSNLGDDKKS